MSTKLRQERTRKFAVGLGCIVLPRHRDLDRDLTGERRDLSAASPAGSTRRCRRRAAAHARPPRQPSTAFAAASSRLMWSAADVSGAPRTSPTIPKRLPKPIVTMRTTSGLRSRVAPNAIGCTMFCSRPFARMTITSMISAVVVPCDDKREEHGERPRDERADEGDVRGDERHDGDRPGERDVEDQRAEPDDDGVERRDDRDAEEVAPQRLDHVARDRRSRPRAGRPGCGR